MAQKFHDLEVKTVTRQTPSAVSLSFNIPSNLSPNFEYLNGQYITIKKNLNGEEVRRSYSICSASQFNEDFTIAIKEVPGGLMSPILNRDVQAGSTLSISEPEGNFVLAPKTKYLNLYAGGSGITPILGILKQALADKTKQINLVYANTSPQEIIFKTQLEELASQHSDRLRITHFIEQNSEEVNGAHAGRISAAYFQSNRKEKVFKRGEHFICGPGPMMQFVKEQLQESGLKDSNIHLEYFEAPEENLPEENEGTFSGNAKVSVVLDGVTTELEVGEKENILGAMLKAGLDAPYSCQGGVCATCRALVKSGDVYLSQNLGITDGEISQGYTLTCSSYPRSSKVEINFDEA